MRMTKADRRALTRLKASVDVSEGYVSHGAVIRFADIDAGRVYLGWTTHRDGAAHEPTTANKCGGCVAEFRRVNGY